jgi:ABC-type phosphate transport system substrate-binding protein
MNVTRFPALVGAACLVTAVVALLSAAQAPAVAVVVVVHAGNPVEFLPREEARNLFLKRTKLWPSGIPVEPVDQLVNPVRRAFSLEVLGREADAVASFWLQQVFSGRDVPPNQVADDASVLGFVRDKPGAIGYISAATPAQGLKVVPIRD